MVRRWWPALGAALVLGASGAWLFVAGTAERTGAGTSAPESTVLAGGASAGRVDSTEGPRADLTPAKFVGSDACRDCHAAAFDAWRPSQHARAMQPATAATVLGDFRDARIRHAGVETTFRRRDGRYFVRTDGPDGRLAEFEVRYTFGVEPLQQYLVPFPDGRMQALPFAWDSRTRERGGQRWFHLRPGEAVGVRDEFHWTRVNANWNFMCADCHATDVRRNYDAAKDTFATQWSELAVGCEACHGPGSAHLAWARHERAGREGAFRVGRSTSPSRDGSTRDGATRDGDRRGLTVALNERDGVRWTVDPGTGNATRSRPRETTREIEVCAPCHARRGQIAEGYRAGARFLDHYRPALLEPGLFHADGQQRDEVFVWGSFLQSRMNHAGVTCSDCHEPHGGRLRADGNAVCAQCHAATKYDADAHHHHGTAGRARGDARSEATSRAPGTQCVDCHMPATTYMVVDPRRDHSFRVPRPDLTASLGTPNACNGCHADRDAAWSVTALRRWNGRLPAGFQRHASAFDAAERGAVEAPSELLAVATDATQSAFARASALERLGAWPSRDSLAAAQRALDDADPLVRRGAIAAFAAVAPAEKFALLAPRLSDPLRAIRLDAVEALAGGQSAAEGEQRSAYDRAAAEFEATQRLNASRPEARAALATFRLREGRVDEARRLYESALTLEPAYAPAYANLADLHRARNDDAAAEATLRRGLEAVGDSALLRHALGLTLVREKRLAAALHELGAATRLAPDDARFAYVYAVALDSAGRRDEARRELARASKRHPDDADLRAARAAYSSDRK